MCGILLEGYRSPLAIASGLHYLQDSPGWCQPHKLHGYDLPADPAPAITRLFPEELAIVPANPGVMVLN
jgi:hypothetical protein